MLPDFMDAATYASSVSEDQFNYYAGSVNKSAMPTKFFGDQLNQLWTHIYYTDSFVSKIRLALTSAAQIGALYDTFLNSNPGNPYEFAVQVGAFSFMITGQADQLFAQVSVSEVTLTIAVISIGDVINHYIDIFITENNRLVIRATPTSLSVVGKLSISAVYSAYLLEITKSGNDINGYSYERIGFDQQAIRSHTVFKTQDGIFTVAGEKGAFILGASPKVNVENYDVATGLFLGSEVLETIPVTGPTYETVWYPMTNISGWTSIKYEEDNSDEKDFPQVYFNGSSSEFVVDYNSVFLIGKTSRKYDVELRHSYTFKSDGEGGFTKIHNLLPMFFIQENEITTQKPFGTCIEKNSSLSFAHTINSTQRAAILTNYRTMKDLQAAYKLIDVDNLINEFISTLPH